MNPAPASVNYETRPELYKHWRLKFEGTVATLVMAIDEDAGLREGYKLKLNSYDLGVDVELNDAVQRVRLFLRTKNSIPSKHSWGRRSRG